MAALSQTGAFEGYASLFNVVDLGRDMVLPGAFRDSLSMRGAAGVKLLWQHDSAQPIGSWLSIAEDSRGLFVRGQLNLDVAKAREVYALMKEGAVDGLSIGFRTQKSVTDPATGVRRLQKVDLWEISIVTFPMLPNARVSSVKHLDMKARLAAAIERGSAQIAAQNARRAMDVRLTRAIERGTQLMARKLFNPDQPRDDHGRWTSGGGVGAADVSGQAPVAAQQAKPIQLALNDTASMSDAGILPVQPAGTIGTAPDGTPIGDGVLHGGAGANVDLAASTKNPDYAARMLGYDRTTFGDMIHAFKKYYVIPPNGNLIWHDDGSTYYNGKYIDNFHNW